MYTPGTFLAGKYELLEVAGQGGMATVWRARTRGAGSFTRIVAVKVMLARLCNDPHFVELFVEEARVSSQFQHPNVVQVFDFGEHQGLYFLAMEWVEGLDLLDYARSFFEQGYFMPWAALATVAVEVLKGMHAAHAHVDAYGRPSPIFHRDVTPHNILLGVNGVVKLTDFGLAKATDRGTLTLPHVLKGKISYTAPEMTRGVRANERTDIFSLGVTLWEALTGRKMFDAASPLQIVRQIQNWNVPPLEELRPDLPPELLRIVARAIARDPEQRFASAQEMALTLSQMLPALADLPRLGRTVADAKARLAQAKAAPPEDFEHLKEALRPSATTAPSFRASNADGRAARVSRNQPGVPVAPPAPLAPHSPQAPAPPVAQATRAANAALRPVTPTQPPVVSPARATPPPQAAPPAEADRASSIPPSRAPILPPEPSIRVPSRVKPPAAEIKISERAPDDFSVVFDDRPASTKPSPGVEPRARMASEPSLLDISIELDFGSGSISRPPVSIPPPAAPAASAPSAPPPAAPISPRASVPKPTQPSVQPPPSAQAPQQALPPQAPQSQAPRAAAQAPVPSPRSQTQPRPGAVAPAPQPADARPAVPPQAPAQPAPPVAVPAARPPGAPLSARSTTNRGLGPPPGSAPPPSAPPASINAPSSIPPPNKTRSTTAPQTFAPASPAQPPPVRPQPPSAPPPVQPRPLPDEISEEGMEISTLFELDDLIPDLVPPKPSPGRPPPLPPKKG